MTRQQQETQTAVLFQQAKHELALLKREGLEWDTLMPLSLRQTQFPSFFEQNEQEH